MALEALSYSLIHVVPGLSSNLVVDGVLSDGLLAMCRRHTANSTWTRKVRTVSGWDLTYNPIRIQHLHQGWWYL